MVQTSLDVSLVNVSGGDLFRVFLVCLQMHPCRHGAVWRGRRVERVPRTRGRNTQRLLSLFARIFCFFRRARLLISDALSRKPLLLSCLPSEHRDCVGFVCTASRGIHRVLHSMRANKGFFFRERASLPLLLYRAFAAEQRPSRPDLGKSFCCQPSVKRVSSRSEYH